MSGVLADGAEVGGTVPAMVLSWLAVVVITGAFAAAVGMLYRGGFSRVERFRLTLALLCFVLSSLTGLLFSSQSTTSMVGQWAGLTLTLIGPAGLWLISLVVISRLWKDTGAAPEEATPATLDRDLIPYGAWKFKHAGLNYLFTSFSNEEYRVREILTFAYFRATEKRKPLDVRISTVFIYYGPRERPEEVRFIKLQRIVGAAKTPPTSVYHIFEPTLPAGTASSFLFVRADGDVIGSASGGPGARRWVGVDTQVIDCLVVSQYPTGNPPEGDYVWIDVPKYTDTGADVSLAFIAQRPIADEGDRTSKLWEVRPSPTRVSADVPVVFRPVGKGHVHSGDSGSVLRPFADWLTSLDKLVAGTGRKLQDLGIAEPGSHEAADPLEFLAKLLADVNTMTGQSGGFSQVFGSPSFPCTCEFDDLRVENPVIATLHWK